MMCFEATGEEWLRNGSKRILYFLSVQSKYWLLQNFLLRGERAAWEDGPTWSAVPGIHSPPEGAQSKTSIVLFWSLVILRFLKSESPPNQQKGQGEEQVKNR